jgi:uncharacterized peroxidase-related enzyme
MAEPPAGFLAAARSTPEGQRLFDDDLAEVGYVMNSSRLWAHFPGVLNDLAHLMDETTAAASLSRAQRAVLVTAAASAFGDSYCSLAWGKRLAENTSPEVAAAVIEGGAEGLDQSQQALAQWARLVARKPNQIAADDVQALRDVGFDDSQIFAITIYVALRLAFATINDSLGAAPDSELRAEVPEAVRSAVTFGRPSGQGGASAPEAGSGAEDGSAPFLPES